MTKKLKVIDHIRDNVVNRVPERQRLGRIEVCSDMSLAGPLTASLPAKASVNYRVTCDFHMIVDDCGSAIEEAKKNAVRALTRALYGELREELIDLLEWSMSEGIGRDLDDRIGRIIRLTEGEEVEDVK